MADLRAHRPSLRDQIAWFFANQVGGLGADKYRQQYVAKKVGGLLDFLPGVGEAIGVDDTKRAFNAGNYGEAALNAGTTAMGVVPGGGDIAAGVAKAIFGGIGARTANKALLDRAQDMAASGASKDAIWKDTGWFKGADGKWRFEIDDSGAKFRPRAAEGFEKAAVGDMAFRHNAEGMMSHSPLHQAYDDLWKVDTTLTKGGGYPYRPSARHQIRESGKEEIFLDSNDLEKAKELNLHELQHSVQMREGFERGADAVSADLSPYRDEIMAKALSAHKDGMPLGDALARAEAEKRWEIYHRAAGEVEARNVERRMNMTPEQRRATPPWATQDVPDELQIVRRR